MTHEIKNINLILNSHGESFSKISSNINTLTNEIKTIQKIINEFKNNKNKNSNNEFQMYNINDYTLEEMKHEYIVKKKQKFKSEIKNDIKNKFICPLLDKIKKKDEEILKLTLENNNLNSEIQKLNNLFKSHEDKTKILSNEVENLKKIIESKNEILKNEINSKIENLIFQNKNEISNLNKNIKIEMENKENINVQKFEKIKKIKDEIYLKITKIEEKHESTTQIFRDEIKKINEKNENLKEKDEFQNQMLIKLNKKNEENELKIENSKKQIETINKIKNNTINALNDSINKFSKLKKNLPLLNTQRKKSEEREEEEEEKEEEEKYKNNEDNVNNTDNLKLNLFSSKNYGRVGLINIGNTCYMNSVLQVLKNIPYFTYNICISSSSSSDKFIPSLKKVLINLCKQNNSSFSPHEFKKYLGIENKLFDGNGQYDSTIFYVVLLNIIHKKLNKAKKENFKKIDMEKHKNKSLKEQFKLWKENNLSINQSFIFELFYIFYVNITECEFCHYKTYTFQNMNFLDLPIMHENICMKSLEECLQKYQIKKNLKVDCLKCKKIGLKQNFKILELPPVFMISLKRVGEGKAYLNEIEIPFKINIKKIIKDIENNNYIYELRGFIKHSGDEKSGHNFAFCKNMFDGKWYEYNDRNCILIDGIPKLDRIFFLCYINIEKDVENIKYLKKIIDSLN